MLCVIMYLAWFFQVPKMTQYCQLFTSSGTQQKPVDFIKSATQWYEDVTFMKDWPSYLDCSPTIAITEYCATSVINKQTNKLFWQVVMVWNLITVATSKNLCGGKKMKKKDKISKFSCMFLNPNKFFQFDH